MRNKIDGYLRAIENGETEKYWDYQAVHKGKMPVGSYVKRWGRYPGNAPKRKND